MYRPPTHRGSRLRNLLASTGTAHAAVSYRPHAVLFSQGAPCDSLMYLEAGRVRLDVLSPDGDKAVCGLMEAGAFLGDEGLTGHALRRHTAIAMCDTEVLVVSKADMVRALHTVPAISDLFVRSALAHAAHLEAQLADQLLHSCAQRLARTLLLLAGCDGRTPCRCPVPRVSQEVVGEMIGTSRSRVNTLLTAFKRRALVEARGGTLYVTPMLHDWIETAAHCARRDSAGAARSTMLRIPGVADIGSART